ncbi:unnamed protein product [Periconia digitata]|uniref:Uncharacterized protein n=1 Tax=Periconia digitata TaxID=1303443 RepID=A0A9W4XXJ1_9PLEO|nr:unnamed protein product [Periconia digitata]
MLPRGLTMEASSVIALSTLSIHHLGQYSRLYDCLILTERVALLLIIPLFNFIYIA